MIRLRYTGVCVQCESALPASTRASWDSDARTVTCLDCLNGAAATEPGEATAAATAAAAPAPTSSPVHFGEAGASARREFEQRHQRRSARIDKKWGPLAGVVKFLSDDPQSTKAWATGSAGERRLAEGLAKRLGSRAVLIHDRKIPGTRANIDHIVVAPTGVWIVDAKKYSGKVERRDVGGWFKTDMRLYVGGRDRTKLCAGLMKQVDAVRKALDDLKVPIRPVLCFVDAEWSLFAKPFELDGVLVTWGKALSERAGAPGDLSRDEVFALAQELVAALPPAVKPG